MQSSSGSPPAQASRIHPGLLAYAQELLTSAAEESDPPPPARIRVKPVRSALYVPANRADWLRKCERFGADAIIADLEDAVLPKHRPEARKVIGGQIQSLSERVKSVWVRVNSENGDMLQDLEAVVQPGLSVVQLPKVHGVAAVLELDRALSYFEGRRGMPHSSIAINPILETANGLRRAYEIASCCRRVEYMGGLIAPLGDTARALGWTAVSGSDAIASESLFLRSKVLLDARSAGVRYPLSGVVLSLAEDQAELKNFARSNKSLGYSGMIAIHPSHISVINATFSPSAEEIRSAAETLEAFRASDSRGAIRGPGGEMIDLAQARSAAALLGRAAAFGIVAG